MFSPSFFPRIWSAFQPFTISPFPTLRARIRSPILRCCFSLQLFDFALWRESYTRPFLFLSDPITGPLFKRWTLIEAGRPFHPIFSLCRLPVGGRSPLTFSFPVLSSPSYSNRYIFPVPPPHLFNLSISTWRRVFLHYPFPNGFFHSGFLDISIFSHFWSETGAHAD